MKEMRAVELRISLIYLNLLEISKDDCQIFSILFISRALHGCFCRANGRICGIIWHLNLGYFELFSNN
jgi:hypothetical protein